MHFFTRADDKTDFSVVLKITIPVTKWPPCQNRLSETKESFFILITRLKDDIQDDWPTCFFLLL